ncbi:hypothetical protein EVAR_93216_1 [Eumeta japonica]|uniref:Uncharacterized protein n=1 Tax=Eumeta variegata TaxID=151549 RepID=A0A4C1TXZ3_EUMVA|nr:hypothetical protein EVAR_93216_1 [Eumeta japonica]
MKIMYPLCNNEHGLSNYGEFAKLNAGENWLLHQERTTRQAHEGSIQTTAVINEYAAILVSNVNTMRAFLKIVAVELCGPEGSLKVHALLDA